MTESGARRTLVSVVVPVYRSEDILPHTHERLTAVLEGLGPGYHHEIVYVDDGSPDGSLGVLHSIAAADSRARVIALSRNFGHQISLTAGLDAARGDVVVVIDDDLQDPPEVIPGMLDLWRAGNQVVYGVRTVRKGESTFKRWTAAAFYRLIQWLSDTPLPLDSGDFRLMDRRVVDALTSMREEGRYVRGMVSWVGYKQAPIAYERDARHSGSGNYTFGKLMRLALDGVLSFSGKPLHLMVQFGMFVTFVSFLFGAYIVFERLTSPHPVSPGWASVIVAVLFMGGVQLISVGVLGAYIGRIFNETKHRPLYLVAERLNEPGEGSE